MMSVVRSRGWWLHWILGSAVIRVAGLGSTLLSPCQHLASTCSLEVELCREEQWVVSPRHWLPVSSLQPELLCWSLKFKLPAICVPAILTERQRWRLWLGRQTTAATGWSSKSQVTMNLGRGVTVSRFCWWRQWECEVQSLQCPAPAPAPPRAAGIHSNSLLNCTPLCGEVKYLAGEKYFVVSHHPNWQMQLIMNQRNNILCVMDTTMSSE